MLRCLSSLHKRRQGRAVGWTHWHWISEDLISLPINPRDSGSELPSNEPKFVSFFLIEAPAGILAFQCNSTSHILFVLFTSLVFQKGKTWALSEDPEERNRLVKGDIHLALKKMSGERSTDDQDVEAAGPSRRRYMQNLPLFLFPHLVKGWRLYAVTGKVGLWYLCS